MQKVILSIIFLATISASGESGISNEVKRGAFTVVSVESVKIRCEVSEDKTKPTRMMKTNECVVSVKDVPGYTRTVRVAAMRDHCKMKVGEVSEMTLFPPVCPPDRHMISCDDSTVPKSEYNLNNVGCSIDPRADYFVRPKSSIPN